ncbi:MAG: DUF2149 domain-containing protein [Methanobacteriaceae archaeon]|nr:DUF2149 domain-containing protein [Methanobacteriaceae archaeon]
MGIKRRKSRISNSDNEIDPMTSAVNMVDIMLVLAVAFLIYAVMSMGLQSVVFSENTPEQKQQMMESIKKTVEMEQGEELTEEVSSQNSSGSGYTEMGKVYKDPQTGKMIMINS